LIDTYGVYSENISETYDRETSDTLPYQVYIPTDGSYTIKFSADNAGYIDMDGVKLIDLSNINSSSPYASQVDAYFSDHTTTKTLTSGWKKVNLFYKNWGGPHSVAASIIYNGRVIWNSRMHYNAKDYQECSGNLSPTKQGCDNPVSTKVYSFVGNVDHTLKITIKGQLATYSNEQYHGDIQKNSVFFNNGLDQINPELTLKILQGRSSIRDNRLAYSQVESARSVRDRPLGTAFSQSYNTSNYYDYRYGVDTTSVNISQQPNSSNDYTAIVDIFDSQRSEGSYSFELYQLKCPV
jgi:hypothetical protein